MGLMAAASVFIYAPDKIMKGLAELAFLFRGF
jgi:hypothetical protein